MFRKLLIFWLVFILSNQPAFSVDGGQSIGDYRRAHEHQLLSEFVSLLSIPNVASDHENIRKNAAFIMQMMQQRGLTPQLLEAKTPNVPPVVYCRMEDAGRDPHDHSVRALRRPTDRSETVDRHAALATDDALSSVRGGRQNSAATLSHMNRSIPNGASTHARLRTIKPA